MNSGKTNETLIWFVRWQTITINQMRIHLHHLHTIAM
jgi:hypothetical protein